MVPTTLRTHNGWQGRDCGIGDAPQAPDVLAAVPTCRCDMTSKRIHSVLTF